MSKPPIETEWTNAVVGMVLRGERILYAMELGAFAVGEQSMTGGPVLHGPWGVVGGMQRDFARYDRECERLNAAFVQGFMRARFKACQLNGSCEARQRENYCWQCGATVIVDHRPMEHRPIRQEADRG